MISKEYLTYLFKSKKVLVVFIALIFMLIGVSTDEYVAELLNFAFATLLCFALPCLLFMYVHDKKAVDTYYQLPIKREALLVTSILFIWIVVYVPYMLSTVVSILKEYSFMLDPGYFASAFGFLALIVVNTYLYLLANSVFDGVVMMCAYEVLPYVFFIVLDTVLSTFVAGFSYSMISWVQYISPVLNAYGLSIGSSYQIDVRIMSGILATIYLLTCGYLLYKSYSVRKVERAGTGSSYPLAYPFIIKIYTFLVVLGFVSSMFDSYSFINAFFNDLFLLVIVFAIYIAAQFVYKRKFYFDWKLPVFFIGTIALSLVLCLVLKYTRGFNLSYSYPKTYENTNVYIYSSFDENEETELSEYLKSQNVYDGSWYYLNVNVDKGYTAKYDPEVEEILNRYRNTLIEDFYAKKEDAYFWHHSSMNVYKYTPGIYLFENNYFYRGDHELSMKDIFTLAKYPYVDVRVDCDGVIYKIEKDGNLRFVESYYEPQYYKEEVVTE